MRLIQNGLNGVGWQSEQAGILQAAVAARSITAFDEQLRSNDVSRQIAQAKRFALWPLLLVLGAFLLPYAWIWITAILAVWGHRVHVAFARAAEVEAKLAAETAQLREQVRRSADSVHAALLRANEGSLEALDFLLNRWLDQRPQSIQRFTAQISGTSRDGWMIVGDAVRRDAIPASAPRDGRGGRVVYDKRKAIEIDEDLSELNALAVVSLLSALFSLPTRQRVTVCISMPNGNAAPVPWITLFGMIGDQEIASVVAGNNRLAHLPTECIRTLGGDAGRCRSQRLTPAGQPFVTNTGLESVVDQHHPLAERTSVERIVSIVSHAQTQAPRAYGTNTAPVRFGDARESDQPSQRVRPPADNNPDGVPYSGVISGGIAPTVSNVRGEFSAAARRFVAYQGDPAARFVQFETYWPTYQNMAPGQLKFYFKWRNSVRRGDVPRADLSYVFVHVYELLHIIGADSARHAAEQLENLWQRYRPSFPKLDNYCVRWTTDLYAKEVDSISATDFVRRVAACGCQLGPDEALLLTDDYWVNGNYTEMPRAGIAALTADQRLGDNKFFVKYNQDGWVERAYREALQVADDTYRTKFGSTLREATIQQDGVRLVVRDPFTSAVYDWKRQPVVLGTVPRLKENSVAVQTFRTAVRYAENILRTEKQFPSKLRGVEIGPLLSAALNRHFTEYVKTARPRTAIRIDLDRARDLTRESEEVRARLLIGIDDVTASLTSESDIHAAHTPAGIPDGLLTDLDAIRRAIDGVSVPARAIIETLVSVGWEADVDDAALLEAASGALVAPLINELNHNALHCVGDVLVVREGDKIIVQEDFRDEVYWVVRGTLDGFAREPHSATAEAHPSIVKDAEGKADTATREGFGPLDLQALSIILSAGSSTANRLSELAARSATTPLLLIDRINEVGLACSYADLLIDGATTPPSVMGDAVAYVSDLVHALAERSPELDSAIQQY